MFVYLDDLIIESRDFESHFDKLEFVLQRFKEAGLKLNLLKCKFLLSRIEFLGHIVDKDCIHTTDAKVYALVFPWSCGLLPFIRDFVYVVPPLTCLLKKDVSFM